MKFIAERAQQQAEDSLQIIQQDNNRNTADSTMIQQSIQRDENDGSAVPNETPGQPIVENLKPAVNSVKPATVKNETKKTVKPVQKPAPAKKDAKPKAVMQNKNDY